MIRQLLFPASLMISLCAAIWCQTDQLSTTRLVLSGTQQTVEPSGAVTRKTFTLTQYISPDGRKRSENADPSGHVYLVTVANASNHSSFIVNPDTKTVQYGGNNSSSKASAASTSCCSPSSAPGPIHPETIAGLTCTGNSPISGRQGQTEITTCKDPVNGKWFIARTYVHDSLGNSSETVLKSIEHGIAVDRSIFEIPQGFRTVQ